MKALFTLVLTAAIGSPGLAADSGVTPLGGGEQGVDGLTWVALPGVSGAAQVAPDADGGKPAMKIAFTKKSAERRLVAVEAAKPGDPTGAKVLAVRCRLTLDSGKAPRLALVVYRDSGAWFRVSPAPLATGAFQDLRLPLKSLKPAAFSDPAADKPDADPVRRIWLGVVVDGPAAGALEVSRAVFTSQPYVPTGPAPVPMADKARWSISKDRAATGSVELDKTGKTATFTFAFPGGRHMFDFTQLVTPEIELEGFRALRFTYKADLPAGIKGLLVQLYERDRSGYVAKAAPPASKAWKTVTIPFTGFALASWTQDENKQLDPNDIGAVCIGVHGTAKAKQAKGRLVIKDIQFVP